MENNTYHFILIPITLIGVKILSWFWKASFQLINFVFGCDWFMGEKLDNVLGYASSLVYADWMSGAIDISDLSTVPNTSSTILSTISDFSVSVVFGITNLVELILDCLPNLSYQPADEVLSGAETFSGLILSFVLFLILLSVLSYGLSVLSVGETIMFVIFKKNSDDDNLLDRKDEDELEEENDDTTLDFNDESERAYSNASSGHSEEE